MAKLVVVLINVWLTAFIFSGRPVSGGYFSSISENSPAAIKKIMVKEPELRSHDEWTILVKAANKALADASIMDIKSAIDILQYPHYVHPDLHPYYVRKLHEINNISEDKCNVVNLPLSVSLLDIKKDARKLPELYKYAKDSLNHYMDVCGLEDRYRDFVEWRSSKNLRKSYVDKQLTLTEQLLREPAPMIGHLTIVDSLNAIELMRDPNLTKEIRCKDGKFIEKLVEAIISRSSKWSRDYAYYVLSKSCEICGHDDPLMLNPILISKMNYRTFAPLDKCFEPLVV